ncbi:mucin-5AC isoform X4 [Drosophila teissieri]|uniref:mucin-5AC isoform X4 n=1 Tax=Drosophila teissieri TaxID=7243 RepID=UPI001CB9FE3F|nr:mucin-5AC isoform X4 [Drosophila teissieri]
MKPFDKYQDIEQGGYAKFTGLKTYNKQLKTMIAIGGWNEASSRFSPLVASNERRQQFIKNILKFLRQNHFDGIDLDWEYPAHREGGKSRDRDNYAQFVQELRAEFEREAEKTGRTRLLLTMAVPAGIEYIDKGYDVPKLNKYLDWFNVLTYDFHSSHEPSVNHHAPLYSLEEDSEYNYDAELNIDYSIKYYLKAGADRDKLVLGIPTYGRSYTLINEESTELGAPAEGPGEQGDATREKGYLAYYEICQTLKDDPEWTVVQPNANVMGPYAYRRNQWVGYDDEAIVRKKAEYVVAQGLGGIMFWAIDNDDFRGTCNGKPYPLIEAAKEAMVEALGLGINEVAKPSGPQKPSRSRSRDNANTRNRLNGKTEAPASSRRPSATRRPTVSSTQPPPPSTTFKLTEAEGSSLYIGGRASTTPPPPTTPDPGSDFKCEEEGFFQHPRDCKKYYWCLDSGPSGLGIVAHMFTCPSGLYFNPAADSCDFARNVPCKTKKSTTAAPVTSTTPTTTTVRSNRVTAAPTARPVYPRTTTTTTSTTTTTTTTPATVDEDLEYEEDTDELSPSKSTDAEEDPQVIKELIDLIRKVGGVEQLEKHLLRNKDGSITLKENSATGAATTPSTISKSLYDRVLSRPGTLNSFSRNRFKISDATETSTEATVSSSSSKSPSTLTSNSNSKYSSVLRGNSRQGPQNEGIEKLAEFDGFLKERKQYVTINRHRSASQGDDEELADQQEEEENLAEVQTTTRRPLSSITPSYTSLRRSRPTTVAPPAEESNVEAEQHTQTQVKSYATLSRTRGRTTASPEVTEAAPSSTTNRYKYFERTRPTKSATADDAEDATEDEEEEYEDEQKDIVTNRYQLSRTRGSTTNTTPTTTATTTTTQQQPQTTTTTARRLTFGGRQRAQVTKLTLVDEQTEETETKGDAREEEHDVEEEEEEGSNATTTTSTTTSRPTPKRIRVLKFRRPLNSNSNSTTTNVDSTTNSATDTNPDTTTTTTTATPTTAGQSTTTSNTSDNSNTTSTTGNKRFRKIVRKLRPVDSSTAASVDNSDETTRKPFVPSHTRFADQDNDLVNLRQRIKEQQARGEPQDGVISNRFKTLGQKDDQDVSELQKLRDKVKAEQARGEGERGVINDRLKKLLAEKNSSISSQREESSTDDDSSSVSSARPFFKRKLVARRPYTPPSASGGTTRAPLTFSTTRPTAKFVRRKNGRFDPFNSSVRNRGEGFVRSDPRGSRLPGADRFKSQGNNEDDDEVEERHEQPLQNQFATTLRRPFVPKTRPILEKAKPQQEEDGAEDSEEDSEEEDSEEEGGEEEDEEEEEEKEKEKPEVEEESPQEDSKPTINSLYKPKDNRAPPGSRPTFGATGSGSPPTASGNVPFNPRNRPSSAANANNTPSNRFGTTKRPRVVNRPPGVASPNLTLKPVASDYERTTPLTPLKPAPFIPSNNRSYERKYSGPSTEAAETSSENSLIEDLNIDALNARNKKIFDKHSKKHPALKPKVVKVESETGLEVETGTEVAVEEETTEEQQQEQGFVTTTPSTPPPSPPSPPAPPSTQSDTPATTTDTPPETETETETEKEPETEPDTEPETEIETAPETETEIETETENVTEIETATNANEATSVNSQDQTISSTTQAPPPATTLLHVFTLLEGEGQEEEPTTKKPTVRLYPTIQTEVVPKHKLVEINRIVEINSKQAKASQRKSKANNDFGILMVESLPHVEQLGEISVVKYVHLVDGSDIQINDGHSTVADYTPTEPTSAAQSPVSQPVRNSLPETEGGDTDRSGKSLVPEVLTAALETSTISLEGLFDSARKGKQLSSNTIIGETEESTTFGSISSTSATESTSTGETTTPAPTYVRPIVPLLRPESNESSPLVISIANLDQVILSKVQNSQATTVAPEAAGDSNSAFSVRQPLVVQAPISSGAHDIDIPNTQDQAISNGAIDSVIQTTTTRPDDDQVAEETTIFSIETATEPQPNTQTTTPKTEANGETLTAMPIAAVIMGQFGLNTQSTATADNDSQLNTQTTSTISSGAVSSEAVGGVTQTTTTADNGGQENTQSEISSGAISTDNNHISTQTTATGNSAETTPTQTLGTISEPIDGSLNLNTQTTTTTNNTTSTTAVGSKVSEAVSFSSETHVVHRKKMGRKGRGRRLRNRKTTTTTTTTTTETPTTVEATFDDTTTVVPE